MSAQFSEDQKTQDFLNMLTDEEAAKIRMWSDFEGWVIKIKSVFEPDPYTTEIIILKANRIGQEEPRSPAAMRSYRFNLEYDGDRELFASSDLAYAHWH